MQIPRLAFSVGEPAGIGPDLAILLAQESLPCELVYFSNADLLISRAELLGAEINIKEFSFADSPACNKKHEIKIINRELAEVLPGKLNPDNAEFTLECLRKATSCCLNRKCAALVTGPVHKGILNAAGFEFTGHTEFLQDFSQSKKVIMLLANKKMRVALATTHVPIKMLSRMITKKSLIAAIEVLHASMLKDFGIRRPKIMAAGLNPHAGESGCLGDEEIKIIAPAIRSCIAKGMNIIGPVAADTMFSADNLKTVDVFLAMFHDQGLPVLKYADFNNSANITLGLPFIRTSVGHGTALELAGSGKAKVSSLQTAINQALDIYSHHA